MWGRADVPGALEWRHPPRTGHYGLSAAREAMEPGDVDREVDHRLAILWHLLSEINEACKPADGFGCPGTNPETRKHALVATGYADTRFSHHRKCPRGGWTRLRPRSRPGPEQRHMRRCDPIVTVWVPASPRGRWAASSPAGPKQAVPELEARLSASMPKNHGAG